jgi:hypothetical protein
MRRTSFNADSAGRYSTLSHIQLSQVRPRCGMIPVEFYYRLKRFVRYPSLLPFKGN